MTFIGTSKLGTYDTYDATVYSSLLFNVSIDVYGTVT